jgi:hypothetical protein
MQTSLDEVNINNAVSFHLAVGKVQTQKLLDLLIRALRIYNHLTACLVVGFNLQFKNWLLSLFLDFECLIEGQQFRIRQLDSIHRILSLFESFFVRLALIKLCTGLIRRNQGFNKNLS